VWTFQGVSKERQKNPKNPHEKEYKRERRGSGKSK
jgi:hypothetical protein